MDAKIVVLLLLLLPAVSAVGLLVPDIGSQVPVVMGSQTAIVFQIRGDANNESVTAFAHVVDSTMLYVNGISDYSLVVNLAPFEIKNVTLLVTGRKTGTSRINYGFVMGLPGSNGSLNFQQATQNGFNVHVTCSGSSCPASPTNNGGSGGSGGSGGGSGSSYSSGSGSNGASSSGSTAGTNVGAAAITPSSNTPPVAQDVGSAGDTGVVTGNSANPVATSPSTPTQLVQVAKAGIKAGKGVALAFLTLMIALLCIEAITISKVKEMEI